MELNLELDNIKCGGCANTIVSQLKKKYAVDAVLVNHENGNVKIESSSELNRTEILDFVKSLGYPEKGTVQGLDKFTTNAKSFVSCAIGRINADQKD